MLNPLSASELFSLWSDLTWELITALNKTLDESTTTFAIFDDDILKTSTTTFDYLKDDNFGGSIDIFVVCQTILFLQRHSRGLYDGIREFRMTTFVDVERRHKLVLNDADSCRVDKSY